MPTVNLPATFPPAQSMRSTSLCDTATQTAPPSNASLNRSSEGFRPA